MSFKNKTELFDSSHNKKREQLTTNCLFNTESSEALQNIHEDEEEPYKTWKDVNISKKVIVFSFRVPKKDMQQLKYISDRTGLSVNAICLLAIQANNRKVLKEFEDY